MSADSLTRLESTCALMRRHGVEFLIVGGMAESVFGSPRVTEDIDICYARTPENCAAIAAALQEIGAKLRNFPENLPFILDAHTIEIGCNFTFRTTLGDFDTLGLLEPIGGFDALAPRAEHYQIGKEIARTLSLGDLIRIKEHLKRPKDLESLFQLYAIRDIRAALARGEDPMRASSTPRP